MKLPLNNPTEEKVCVTKNSSKKTWRQSSFHPRSLFVKPMEKLGRSKASLSSEIAPKLTENDGKVEFSFYRVLLLKNFSK